MSDTESIERVADLSRIIDPATVWPNPMDCPDYPLNGQVSFGISGMDRADVEFRLSKRLEELHGEGAALRDPSPEEKAAAAAEHLTNPQGEGPPFYMMVRGSGPYSSYSNTKAGTAIVECIHLRGYLRKLDAQAAAKENRAADQKREEHQRTLDGYVDAAKQAEPDLTALSEGFSRYEAWLADKRAWERAVDIRTNLEYRHNSACIAASALDLPAPPFPDVGTVGKRSA